MNFSKVLTTNKLAGNMGKKLSDRGLNKNQTINILAKEINASSIRKCISMNKRWCIIALAFRKLT